MKTLLAILSLALTACGSSEYESEQVDETVGVGWNLYEFERLQGDCMIASEGLFPEVSNYPKFCECWAGYVAARISPESYSENTFAVLQLLGNKPRNECSKTQQ